MNVTQLKNDALRRDLGMAKKTKQPQKGSTKRKPQSGTRRTSRQSRQIGVFGN